MSIETDVVDSYRMLTFDFLDQYFDDDDARLKVCDLLHPPPHGSVIGVPINHGYIKLALYEIAEYDHEKIFQDYFESTHEESLNIGIIKELFLNYKKVLSILIDEEIMAMIDQPVSMIIDYSKLRMYDMNNMKYCIGIAIDIENKNKN